MREWQELEQYGAEYGIPLTGDMVAQFARYAELLVDWNTRINLTAITALPEIGVKHFLDSLLLLKAVELPQGSTLIDVGTGAGFPGVPAKIARPDLQLTLLDSLNKRVNFLQTLSQALEQGNVCVHGRAEETARNPAYREKFDLATARAVAALPALCEYCLPFVRVGGRFAALKGYDIEGEVEASTPALRLLGGQVEAVHKFELPMDNRRAIVVIKKISQTPPKYPRAAVKITKSPL